MLGSINRTLAFFVKWLAEVIRQPALMLSLVVGPFLILLAFGEGVKLGAPKPTTILVLPTQTDPNSRIQPVPDELRQYLRIEGETTDLAAARQKLRTGEIELVAVVPPDPLESVRKGEHATVTILTNDIDPVRKSYSRAYLREQIALLNQQTLQKAITDAQASAKDVNQRVTAARQAVALTQAAGGNQATITEQSRVLSGLVGPLGNAGAQASVAAVGAAFVVPGLAAPLGDAQALTSTIASVQQAVARLGGSGTSSGAATSTAPSAADLAQLDNNLAQVQRATAEITAIPPEVLSAPFQADLQNIAPFEPTYIGFYAPAVLALLLQHLAMTLGALSMARIRLLGLMELLQTSPVRPVEAVLGNYLSYGVLCGVAGGLLLALLVYALGVPVFGSYLIVAGMLGLLILASLGVGFIISMIASSEQQAAQLAMLLLISTVFFSGFVVPPETIAWPVRALSFLLPATYAIRTLQDVMLRGVLQDPLDLIILGVASVGLFLVTVGLFRREYRPR